MMVNISIEQRASTNRLRKRSGKVLVLLAVSMPAIFGLMALIFDAGLLSADCQDLQQATDAAATAGAYEILQGRSSSVATSQAESFVKSWNSHSDATVQVNIPPTQGVYAGRTGCVEVLTTRQTGTRFISIVGGSLTQKLQTRSVAATQNATTGSAVVVLDKDPPSVSLAPIPLILPSFPALLGGLEVLGLGSVKVNGAVLVNTAWGGIDESGYPAGLNSGPPYAVSCTPLLGLTKLNAVDIRVSGGVDSLSNYVAYDSGKPSPLRANRTAVPDPLSSLPVPSTANDSDNVSSTYCGGVTVISLPLIILPTVLRPGVYDYIEVISGNVIFQPGVYIIRGKKPITGLSLNLVGGFISAQGVLFYITDSAGYDASSGSPDSGDGETEPAMPALLNSLPSVVINAALIGSTFSPLSDAGSPFDGMLIYQRRKDFRPIVIANQQLLGGSIISGRIYSKWGHVLFAGSGNYDVSIVAGTVRLVTILNMTLNPTNRLAAAQDVFLVE
jgi:Flp pilus assembly protein TadG